MTLIDCYENPIMFFKLQNERQQNNRHEELCTGKFCLEGCLMNIKDILIDQIKPIFDYDQEQATRFINEPTREDAVDIAKRICDLNNKRHIIGKSLEELTKLESVPSKRRDHVIHTIHTYLLGMHIIEKLNWVLDDEFTWKIASLFHDIGYRREIDYQLAINFPKKESSLKNICTDHGFWSAYITWNKIYAEYLKINPGKENGITSNDGVDYSWKNLEENILPACEAILLHNKPQNYLSNKKVDYRDNKFAFLLILCDTVQIWDRPNNGEFDFSKLSKSKDYNLECSNRTGEFHEIIFEFSTPKETEDAYKELNLKCKYKFLNKTPDNKLTVHWYIEPLSIV